MFESVCKQLSWDYYKKGFFLTMRYSDYGFSAIRLYEFKNKMYETEKHQYGDSEYMYLYMIAITVNVGLMFGKNGYYSNNIISFTPDFVKAIYSKTYDFLPCIESGKEYRANRYELWQELNSFKLRRIDFTFDLKDYSDIYLSLLDRGYDISRKGFERTYFEKDDTLAEEQYDDEPDIPDLEDCIQEMTGKAYKPDDSYIYYKGKSYNINVYLKAEQLERKKQQVENIDNYNFLRIEVQVKKPKLNVMVKKFGLKGRELQYLAVPEIENYVLCSYVQKLTGAGLYVTKQQAFDIIDGSEYTIKKKQRLKAVIEAVANNNGIKYLLEKIENGQITNLGKLSTVRTYLREIHKMGINPVTIDDMNIPDSIAVSVTDENDFIKLKALPNLVDILKSYNNQIITDQKQGMTYTEEDFKAIDAL